MPRGSWKTAMFGYLILGLDFLKLISDAITEKGVPTDMNGWIVFVAGLATGVGLIAAKDYDKSNAPAPVAAATVSEVNAVKPNPSAPVPSQPPPFTTT